MQSLLYKKSSEKWENGLPIGNGVLAAMVWDNEQCDILSLNHEKLWTGKNKNRECVDSAEYLPIVRKYLEEEKYFEATVATNLFFGGIGGLSEIENRVDSFQPAGNLIFKHRDDNKIISRELNIENGTCTTVRENVSGTYFADCNNKIVCCKWAGENISGDLFFEREKDENATYSFEIKNNEIIFFCTLNCGVSYKTVISVSTDGISSNKDCGISIENATYLIVYLNIFMSEENVLANFPEHTLFDSLLKAHKDKFSNLMNRTTLTLYSEEKNENIPTDIRIKNIRNDNTDILLCELYFDFGRYLLLSCCICADLPANLQGKWNIDLLPPWRSDYHTNINLQMSYWMTEALGMQECSETLFRYIKNLIPSGKEAAQKLYGCRGVWFSLQGDCWHKATPESFGCAAWIGAAPWLAQHMWKHYTYTNNIKFLENDAYPFFKEIAEFYEDYLVKDKNGIYQIMPSQSPENGFEGTGIFTVSICISSAMDIELAYDALSYAINSAKILKRDLEQVKIWEELKNNLPELKVGSDGRLLEWNDEKFVEKEPGHRHVSHLYGLYPSDIINEYDSPKLYNAAIKSLDTRMSTGGGHTGWSRAWVSSLYAKCGNKDLFLEHYEKLISDFATDSLLDLHPPRIFQIDGNLGAVAALIEALVSVSGEKVRLLNALPDKWTDGSIDGIYIPGGHKISFIWKDNKVTELTVEFGFENEILFVINGEEILIRKDNSPEKTLNFNLAESLIS